MGSVLVQRSREDRPVERLHLRVEAASAAAASGELSAQEGVLNEHRGQQSGRDSQELGPHVLHLAFQLHPPVLEPRFNLRDATQLS